MSWRTLAVLVLPVAIGCSDGSGPATPTAVPESKPSLNVIDPTAQIKIVQGLDGSFTPLAFNKHDVITGYETKGTNNYVFRWYSPQNIQIFQPPTGFVPGNFCGEFGVAFPQYKVGIDSLGNVAGGVDNDTAYRAFVWSPAGTTTLLTPTYPYLAAFGTRGCNASGMSPGGYVVGNCDPDVNFWIAEWAPAATDTLRTSCCNSFDGNALAVTDNQYITGFMADGPPQTFIWPPNQGWTVIGFYFGTFEVSVGLDVNSDGWIAGWAENPTINTGVDTLAVIWFGATGGQTWLTHYGQTTGIDDNLDATGWHRVAPGAPPIAFVWNRRQGVRDLPGLYPGGASQAVAINGPLHQILGWALDAAGVKHVVIWVDY